MQSQGERWPLSFSLGQGLAKRRRFETALSQAGFTNREIATAKKQRDPKSGQDAWCVTRKRRLVCFGRTIKISIDILRRRLPGKVTVKPLRR